MAVRFFTPDGYRFECDSPAEARDVYVMLSNRMQSAEPADHGPRKTPDDIPSRSERRPVTMTDENEKFVLALVNSKDGMSTADLANAAGIEIRRLPTAFRSATIALKKRGYKEPITREGAFLDGKYRSWYRISKEVAENFTAE